MKTLRNIILIVLCSVACDRNVEPFTPCMSFTAPWPLEWAQQTWACMNMPRPEDSYNYPIGLGLEESKVFQIPPCVLEKMSTQAVIQAIWELPQFVGLLDGDRYQTNFDALFSNHHVYVELTKRKDAAAVLLARLELVDPFAPLSQALAILMAQPVILTQLTDFEKKSVVAACVKNDTQRVLNSSFAAAYLLAGRTMLVADYTPFVDAVSGNAYLERFLDGREVTNAEQLYGDILWLVNNHSMIYLGVKPCENPSTPMPCIEIQKTWEGMNMSRPAGSYNFPLYPGIPEWENLTTYERRAAMQVPLCVLEKMSTQAVIQAIWEDCFLHYVFSGFLYQVSTDSIMIYSNACKELAAREDAGTVLLERLELMDGSVFRTFALMMLISQNVFLSQIDNQQKRKIVEVCLMMIDLQRNSINFLFNREIVYLLIARTMCAADYPPFLQLWGAYGEDGKAYLNGYWSDGQAYKYYCINSPYCISLHWELNECGKKYVRDRLNMKYP